MKTATQAALALIAAFSASAASADEWATGAESRVRLANGGEIDTGVYSGAVHIQMTPGWKTYWRSPGESGIPPQMDWSGSVNVGSVVVEWPRPEMFDAFGYRTIGYDDEVAFPVRVEAATPAEPVELNLSIMYGVCGDLCIPERATLATALTPGGAGSDEDRSLIEHYGASLALTPDQAGVEVAACDVKGAGDRRDFSARLTMRNPPAEPPVIVVEGPETVWIGKVATTVEGDTLTATATIDVYDESVWFDRSDLRLTVFTADAAVDIKQCVSGSS